MLRRTVLAAAVAAAVLVPQAAHAGVFVDPDKQGGGVSAESPGSSSGGSSGSQGGSGGSGDAGGVLAPDCDAVESLATSCETFYPPAAPTPPGESIAQRAYDHLSLPKPTIRMAPAGTKDVPAIVNLETWLWVEGGWSTERAEAKAGDAKVTAAARPTQIVWDMGDGRKEFCGGPGRPWRKGMGDAKTTCGHTFRHASKRQPGGTYKVRVFVRYSVDWRCSGDCEGDRSGTLDGLVSPTTTAEVEVKERQAVVLR